ncbi:energy transducer TonB [Sphingomonas yunnanensis]|uniref:energy transducer TonB family protein n=1 Tax=Sphingomonas yunnanensis TaxID=310400 RepID=UPI001CA65FD0|nr:energy transducer TonB [Sphingomonas yunnanensis]MBY9062799.1 energy transducer TonB [Sphingomonas yunnanensis]
MKHYSIVIAAICALYPSLAPAQPRQGEVTVRGDQRSRERWVAAVTRRLEAALLRQQDPIGFDAAAGGIVSVRFTLDERHRPSAPTLARSSSNRRLDRVALLAVRRLGELPALSWGTGAPTTVQANMIFASDYLDYRNKLATLRREIRLARGTDGPTRLASAVMVGAAAN